MHYLITDEKGKAVGEGYVKAEQFIMKDGIVTFNDSISFDAPAGTKGFLRLTNNAASQQAGFQRSMTIPVVLK
jgi:hypothetical protein